ncbi:hypothetical protein ACQ4PT_070700 [Festuca glaucescens]
MAVNLWLQDSQRLHQRRGSRSSSFCSERSNMHRFFSLSLILLVWFLSHEGSYSAVAAGSGGCQRLCGGGITVPYPFGFSAGCPIALSCDANTSTPILPSRGDNGTSYRILAFNSTASTAVLALPSSCSRSIPTLEGCSPAPTMGSRPALGCSSVADAERPTRPHAPCPWPSCPGCCARRSAVTTTRPRPLALWRASRPPRRTPLLRAFSCSGIRRIIQSATTC